MGYSPKNKADRERIAKKKHKRRCDAMGLDTKTHYAFKADAKPCSCWLCSNKGNKRDTIRPKIKVMTKEEIDAIRLDAYDYVI